MDRTEARKQRENIQRMRSVLNRAAMRAARHGDWTHNKACRQVEAEAMRLQTQILAEMDYQQNGKRGHWRR